MNMATNSSKSQLMRLTVSVLKEQLQQIGLPIAGLKKDLVDRLYNARQELASSGAPQSSDEPQGNQDNDAESSEADNSQSEVDQSANADSSADAPIAITPIVKQDSRAIAEAQSTDEEKAQQEEAERIEAQRQQLLDEREKLYSSYLRTSPSKSPVKRSDDETKSITPAKQDVIETQGQIPKDPQEKEKLADTKNSISNKAVVVDDESSSKTSAGLAEYKIADAKQRSSSEKIQTNDKKVLEDVKPESVSVKVLCKDEGKSVIEIAKLVSEPQTKENKVGKDSLTVLHASTDSHKSNVDDKKVDVVMDTSKAEKVAEKSKHVATANDDDSLRKESKNQDDSSTTDHQIDNKKLSEQKPSHGEKEKVTPLVDDEVKSEPIKKPAIVEKEKDMSTDRRSVRKLKIHRKGSSSDIKLDTSSPSLDSSKERKLVKPIEPPNYDKDSDTSKAERKAITSIKAPTEKSTRVVRVVKNEVASKTGESEELPVADQQTNGAITSSSIQNKVQPKPAEEIAQKGPTPPRNPPSTVLFVSNLTRPFTLNRLYEVLSKNGTICEEKFWIDKIKSRCIVMYASVEEATAARASLHGQRWPDSNPKVLSVDFSTEKELDEQVEKDKALAVVPVKQPDNRPETASSADKYDIVIRKESGEGDRRDSSKRPVREWDREKLEKDRETSPNQKRRRSRSPNRDDRKENVRDEKRAKGDTREQTNKSVPPGEESPAKLLDDLFNKTKAVPCIYWLPLTEEQAVLRSQVREEQEKKRKEEVAARDAENAKHQEELRARRMANSPRGRSPFGGFRGNRGGPPGRRGPPFRDNRSPPRRRRSPSSSRSRSRSKSRSPLVRGRPGPPPPPPPHMHQSRSPRRSPPRRDSPPRRGSPPRSPRRSPPRRGSPSRRRSPPGRGWTSPPRRR